MCKATVEVELKFNTAVTDVETSFEKLILDRTRNRVRSSDAYLTFLIPDKHTMFIHPNLYTMRQTSYSLYYQIW
jgi:hypothetical protein